MLIIVNMMETPLGLKKNFSKQLVTLTIGANQIQNGSPYRVLLHLLQLNLSSRVLYEPVDSSSVSIGYDSVEMWLCFSSLTALKTFIIEHI
mmetsp:Transcript_31962/g.42534  ORF Transcript_31962/g.42534 Transcript_31962/m.42534 type:complete len:91 (-) Transcript_31962:42-314(-)